MRILAFNVTHDSSVCCIKDGEIEFFCKEERLTRKKRDPDPFASLEAFRKTGKEPDHVLYLTPSNNEGYTRHVYEQYTRKVFGKPLENFSSLQHHLAHASLAFYNSGFEECLVFVIDRNGSLYFQNDVPVAREAETVFRCSYPDNLIPLYKSFSFELGHEHRKYEIRKSMEEYFDCDIEINNTLGIVKVYEAATTMIGQSVLENGKTMGLVAYGEDKEYDPLFLDGVPISDKFEHVKTSYTDDPYAVCFAGEEDLIRKDIKPEECVYYANRAKQVQLQTQEAALDLIKRYLAKTGIKKVCLVGGYGLNVIANSYYKEKLPDVDFYFEPVADDAGVSIGAAMYKYRNLTKDITIKTPKDNFYHHYEDEENKAGIVTYIHNVCQILDSKKTVAIFDGAPEAGPRALGHRSILFDPRHFECNVLMNTVKNREWYRPFAGICLEEHFDQLFETLGVKSSPYMTMNFKAKEWTIQNLPGILHHDKTCRVQTVKDGFIRKLLERWIEITGCPMLLNTSFNLAGQPLVHTKKEAIETVRSSYIDCVYFVDTKRLVGKR